MGITTKVKKGLKKLYKNVGRMTAKLFKRRGKMLKSRRKHRGGMAPISSAYSNMRQPSENIMKWATTAGAPTPTSGMRNVAHGGRRRTRGRR